jgi:hypothetical protein
LEVLRRRELNEEQDLIVIALGLIWNIITRLGAGHSMGPAFQSGGRSQIMVVGTPTIPGNFQYV